MVYFFILTVSLLLFPITKAISDHDDFGFKEVDHHHLERDIFVKLAHPVTFKNSLEQLYDKYGSEIAKYRVKMKRWCNYTRSCKFGDFEAEMLYMMIREVKPKKVFEMAPNRGYSSHWILEALHLNDDNSTLTSVDIHNSSLSNMDPKYTEKNRWIFKLGDYQDLLDQGHLYMEDYDYIFIDALHTEEFSAQYVKRLLVPLNHRVHVTIHDIVDSPDGGGRESSSIYKCLSFAHGIHGVFTMSIYCMPNFNDPYPGGVRLLNKIRSAHKIIPPCVEEECDAINIDLVAPAVHNNAPAIFFLVDAKNKSKSYQNSTKHLRGESTER